MNNTSQKLKVRKSRELQLETENKNLSSPSIESSDLDTQGEETHESPMNVPLEPVETLERSLEEPPIKRKPAWFKEIM